MKRKASYWVKRARGKAASYLTRRPHRSFRRTRRRDYVRSLKLPGYWAFSAYVLRTVWGERRLLSGLVAFYALLSVVFIGLASQAAYIQLSDLLDQTGSEVLTGGWGAVGQASLLLLSGISGSFNPELTDAQQVYAGLIFLLTWLTTIWLLRAAMGGKHVRLRDGLYNAGAPIVATAVVLVVLLIQLVPAALAVLAFNSAVTAGLFEQGFIAMIVSLFCSMLVLLSIYWSVSTFVALIIVTLPGMYPWQAVKSAGDIVIGRRIRILLRIAWLLVINVILWIVVMLPVVLLTRAIGNVAPLVSSLPVVPVIMTVMGSIIVVWSAAYIYLLYRKVVEDDALPA